MAYDTNNIFARILRGEIPCNKIGENAHALAFYDIAPAAKAHALVIPKGAYADFGEFAAGASPDEMRDWLHLIDETARRIGVGAGGYRLIANTGADARQEVPHLHMHILGGEDLGRMMPAK